MRSRCLVLVIVGVVVAAGATIAMAQSSTALSNVAAFQATEGTLYSSSYPTARGVDDGVYRFSHGDNTGTSNYWKVDLGATYDVDHLVIDCRYDYTTDYTARTNGATLMAFAADGLTKVADNLVLSGFTFNTDKSLAVYRLTFDNGGAGYAGVRYFQIGGIDPTDPLPIGLGVNYLHVGEFKAYAQVPVYDTFIQGVTATNTETNPYIHLGVSATFLVDHSGMNDQHTLLGDPAATHNVVSGQCLFHANSNATDATPILTFDLHGRYELDQMVVWNQNQSIDRCTKECLIEYSTNGSDWTQLADANGEGGLGNYTLTAHDGLGGPYPATDTVNLTDITASYVRLQPLTSYGTSTAYVGLSEVRFYGELAPAVQIPGDATGEGIVNSDDAQILAQNWGMASGATWGMGDFTGEGAVDAADASILAANWGYGASESAAVPEPSALAPLGALLLLVLRRRRIAKCL